MITKTFRFENGDPVEEKITGFKGIITGTCFYLTGCTQHLVTAKAKDGKEPIALWYDDGRLQIIPDAESIKAEEVIDGDNGCDLLPNVGSKGA